MLRYWATGESNFAIFWLYSCQDWNLLYQDDAADKRGVSRWQYLSVCCTSAGICGLRIGKKGDIPLSLLLGPN
jgi:hypothetical protein